MAEEVREQQGLDINRWFNVGVGVVFVVLVAAVALLYLDLGAEISEQQSVFDEVEFVVDDVSIDWSSEIASESLCPDHPAIQCIASRTQIAEGVRQSESVVTLIAVDGRQLEIDGTNEQTLAEVTDVIWQIVLGDGTPRIQNERVLDWRRGITFWRAYNDLESGLRYVSLVRHYDQADQQVFLAVITATDRARMTPRDMLPLLDDVRVLQNARRS